MRNIRKANIEDSRLLSQLGKVTFLESHGHSAPVADIDNYVRKKYNEAECRKELNDATNVYHIIYHNEQPAGFSKIIFNAAHPEIENKNSTKLERIYLLKEFYGLSLGHGLFQFNLALSKKKKQSGMWLFVWKENQRAIRFYTKAGFKIIGSHDFSISSTHNNPNHIMWMMY